MSHFTGENSCFVIRVSCFVFRVSLFYEHTFNTIKVPINFGRLQL